MSISEVGPVLEHQLFLQGDARDPLGVWNVRHQVTGDATGGEVKVGLQITAARSTGRIYTAYGLQVAGIGDVFADGTFRWRLLTNRPDADVIAGIQGFGTLVVGSWNFQTDLTTDPFAGPGATSQYGLNGNDRFILLYGPTVNSGDIEIAELTVTPNIDAATYVFEGYGYFWDRGAMNAPGGPRHPGSA